MTTALTKKLQGERVAALSHVLEIFADYLNGVRRLSDGQTLQEVLGDYHLDILKQTIEAHYRVQLTDCHVLNMGVDAAHLDTLLNRHKPGVHSYNQAARVLLEFKDVLGSAVKEAADAQDMREVSAHAAASAWEDIMVACGQALAPVRGRG